MRNLHKRFGEVHAVRGVDLDLYPGEVHALLGENGAGKSTVMSVLCGLHRPDGGTVELDGQRVVHSSPRQAMDAGVGMVHQHFMLAPGLTAAENILLGAARIPALLRPRALLRRMAEQAEALGFGGLDLDQPVEALTVGEQQRVEILRVLCRGARVMILDEPTAVLGPVEAEGLMSSIERLRQQGCAVVLISHKLAEVQGVASRLTVMRRGEVVARHDDMDAVDGATLAAEMVGREVSLELRRPERAPGEAVLRLRGVQVRDPRRAAAVKGIDLQLHAGEIVGLAGVAGNGQLPLMEALAGTRPLLGGAVELDGRELGASPPAARVAAGLRYIPEDRNHTGTAPGLTVRENLLLRDYRSPACRRGPWLDLRGKDDDLRRQLRQLQVNTTGLDQRAGVLSGGNIQKLVVARELAGEPRVLLAMQPTRGLDAWATAQVRQRLLEAKARGAAVLLCSEDLDEVMALSDRIAVMRDGALAGIFDRPEADRARIGRLMTA